MKRSFTALAIFIVMALGGGLVYTQATGSKLFSVQTGSMTPSINKGDLVAVNRVPANQLAVGDVITYVSPSNPKKTITHRVVAAPSPQSGSTITTKGDANPTTDKPFSPKYVLGKVRFNAPYAGYGVDFVRKPVGLAVLIYLPALIVIIGEIRKLSEHYRKMRPYFSARKILRRRKFDGRTTRQKLAFSGKFAGSLMIALGIFAWPAYALLTSNQVTLADSSFSVTAHPPPPHCEGDTHNTTNVHVTNNSNQTAVSGDATNSDNTNGGNATSGNASNCNSTNINISITNNP